MSPTFEEFLRLDPEAGYAFMEESPEHARVVREGMGERAFGEYEATRGTATEPHLGITPETTMLFLPGIMGSSLTSEPLGGIWWLDVLNPKAIDRLGLSANGTTDADPANDIQPLTTDHRYAKFLQACRDQSGFVHDKLPYDWRKSLRLSADAFRDRIVAIHDANGGQAVDVAAHSMGGVLTRVSLMVHGDELWPKIGRIAFIGTPHYGATAIGGYLKNHFWGVDMLAALSVLLRRETFRTMRGALGLLPAPADVYPATREDGSHPCANFDLYDAGAWRLDLSDAETAHLQDVLDGAAALHRDLHDFHLGLTQEKRDRMLAIAGVGIKTLFRLEYRKTLGFLWEHMNKVTDQDPNDPNRLGDGRVPLPSAALEHVGETRYVRGVHGGLPNLEPVYLDVFRWFRGEPLELPVTPQAALANDLGTGVTVSSTPTLDGSGATADGDPGYLDLDALPEEMIEALVQRVSSGQWPEFRTVSIL